jgi:hypothetical protein
MAHEDEDRVDGRELVELDEPGSDARLLRGLLLALAAQRLSEPVESSP